MWATPEMLVCRSYLNMLTLYCSRAITCSHSPSIEANFLSSSVN